jgi:pyrroline-5-carboxylate reductase
MVPIFIIPEENICDDRIKRLLIIGAGRMAQAIMEGMQNKREFVRLVANNGNEKRLNFVREKYGVATTDCWQREA